MQNLVAKSWKLTELLAVKFTVLKTNHSCIAIAALQYLRNTSNQHFMS